MTKCYCKKRSGERPIEGQTDRWTDTGEGDPLGPINVNIINIQYAS